MINFNKYFNNLPKELEAQDASDETKLLKLFAYNAYFNADLLRTEECNEGYTFKRKNNYGIDGVYLNESLEDTTIELVYSYWSDNDSFNINQAVEAIDRMADTLKNVNKRIFTSGNKEAEDLISNYLDESETKTVILRVITNVVPNELDKYKWSKMINNHNVSIKNLNVSSAVSFGGDIEEIVESNIAPFDYVERDKLVVDINNNILKYNDHSFVCNISAKSLKALWAKEGQRGLLAMNLRYYIKSKNIDNKIEESIISNFDNFWYLNNGIIIVCDDFKFVNDELRLDHFSIVNGGQTTRMIGEIPFENDFFICCKVIKNIFETNNEKNQFIANIAEATNTQKPIKAKDIIANKIEQRNLKTLMQDNKIFIEIKRGEKYNHEVFKEPWQRTKNNELAQDLFSFVFMEPGPARNNVSSILQNNEKYDTIFVKHQYPVEFFKSVLFLEKAYREYNKRISKDQKVDPTKKGLVKNGMFYTLATIGYLLKLAYNSEYFANMQKYQNDEGRFDIFSSELAFSHAFIDPSLSYKDFLASAFQVFDHVVDNYLCIEFNNAKETNPSLAYSNWLKTNTGFNAVRKRINSKIFDQKNTDSIDFLKARFVEIDEDLMNKNIDSYVDLLKKNPKIKAKDNEGNELSEEDEALRNELLLYRMNYCALKHKAESTVFTEKMLDKLVVLKPISESELKKIITNPLSIYYCGKDILAIIQKYL